VTIMQKETSLDVAINIDELHIIEEFHATTKEGKEQDNFTISSTPSIQEGLQEESICGVENHINGHIKRIRPCPV
ncbi:hypothetical protein KI387_018910, partial [Taxus chinensis]